MQQSISVQEQIMNETRQQRRQPRGNGGPQKRRAQQRRRRSNEDNNDDKSWADVLLNIVREPDHPKHRHSIYDMDEQTVIIYDKFPKSRRHMLILPRNEEIDGAHALTKKHLPLLRYMQQRGLWLIQQLTKEVEEEGEGVKLSFKMGYHAVPTLRQLHLHVLSKDHDAPAMNRVKHWNSFTTDFLVPPEEMIRIVEEEGRFDPEPYARLKHQLPMKCNECGETNIPHVSALREHIQACLCKKYL
ncbi:aprataxin-like protein [Balamuthia mandrillaris]